MENKYDIVGDIQLIIFVDRKIVSFYKRRDSFKRRVRRSANSCKRYNIYCRRLPFNQFESLMMYLFNLFEYSAELKSRQNQQIHYFILISEITDINIYRYIRIFSLGVLIALYRVMVSEDIKNLREVEDAGRIIIVYYCSQAIYIEEGFLLDRKNSCRNRYHFERDKDDEGE